MSRRSKLKAKAAASAPRRGSFADDDAVALAVLAAAPAHSWPEWVRAEDAPLGNWVAGLVGHERARCAAAALAVLRFIAPRLPRDADGAMTTLAAVQQRVAVVAQWRADGEAPRAALDARRTPVIDRVDAWIDCAADFAVLIVSSGALDPRPHLCAGLTAICAQRALASDGVRGKQSAVLVARAAALFGVDLVAARVDGKKLYLKGAGDPEVAYDWAGPAGAHYATLETSSATHEYTTKLETTICIYDSAGTLLGELTEERWI